MKTSSSKKQVNESKGSLHGASSRLDQAEKLPATAASPVSSTSRGASRNIKSTTSLNSSGVLQDISDGFLPEKIIRKLPVREDAIKGSSINNHEDNAANTALRNEVSPVNPRSAIAAPSSSPTATMSTQKRVGGPQFAETPKFVYRRRERPNATPSQRPPPTFKPASVSSSSKGLPSSSFNAIRSSSDIEDTFDLEGSPSLTTRNSRKKLLDLISDVRNNDEAEVDDDGGGPTSGRKKRRLAGEKSFDFDDEIEDEPDDETMDEDAMDEIESDPDSDDSSKVSNRLQRRKSRNTTAAEKNIHSGGRSMMEFKTPSRPPAQMARNSALRFSSGSKPPMGTSPFPNLSTLPTTTHPIFQSPASFSSGSSSQKTTNQQQQRQQQLHQQRPNKPFINFLETPKLLKIPGQGSIFDNVTSNTNVQSTSSSSAFVAGFHPGVKPNFHLPPTDWSPSHRRHKSASTKYKPKGLAATALRWAFDANDQILRAGYVATGGEKVGHLEVVEVKKMDTYLAVRGYPGTGGDWWMGAEESRRKPLSALKFNKADNTPEKKNTEAEEEDERNSSTEDEHMELIDSERTEEEDKERNENGKIISNVLLVNDLKTPWTGKVVPGAKVVIGEPYWITELDGLKWTFAINWDVIT